MAILPATGSAIKMGAVYTAYANAAPTNVRLSATLGASYGGVSSGTPISLSSTFGGKTTPFGYT